MTKIFNELTKTYLFVEEARVPEYLARGYYTEAVEPAASQAKPAPTQKRRPAKRARTTKKGE